MLPAWKFIHDQTGVPPLVIVSTQYASVLEGASYVKAMPLDIHWWEGVPEARETSRRLFGEPATVVQAWNDDLKQSAAEGAMMLHVHGLDWSVDQRRWPDYMTSMYDRSGITRDEMLKLPLVFNQRDEGREHGISMKVIHRKKPTLLVNWSGQASPFAPVPEVMAHILPFKNRLEIVDIGSVHAHRIYDLIGVMDRAIGMITIDTSTLHLAHASKKQYIAFTRNGWSGSIPRGPCALHIEYSDAIPRAHEIPPIIERWLDEFQSPAEQPAPAIITPKEPMPGKPILTVRRSEALGDVLAATAVADRLIENGLDVIFEANANAHCILRRHPGLRGITIPHTTPDINLDGAYESHANRKKLKFSQMFTDRANEYLKGRYVEITPLNHTPRIYLTDNDRCEGGAIMSQHPRPWITICPRSNSWAHRTVPDRVWQEAAKRIKGTCFWLGSHAPALPGIVDLACKHVDNLVRHIGVSDLLISVDSGPMHIGAALKVPTIAILQSSSPELHLSDQNDFEVIAPDLECLNCQLHACPINITTPPCQNISPERIAEAANRKLNISTTEGITALVSIYRPDVDVLNRCLTCVLPQVQEVIVCNDLAGKVPDGVITNDKIRFITKQQFNGGKGIGYGGKQNYAARHSSSPLLLCLNDDVFLAPDAVAKMRECLTDQKVAMVSNLLRYPDGKIYHAGKVRVQGERGWAHINHGGETPFMRQPTEVENACGACVLVRRTAFYDINGFDERIYLYGEDDLFAFFLRKNGWKIMFTPKSSGVHLNHHSTKSLPDFGAQLSESNAIVNQIVGAYIDHNLNRVPLGNFDYLHV